MSGNEAHPVVVTFLEMRCDPQLRVVEPCAGIDVVRAPDMPVHFYRYLYDVVGQDYMWFDRTRLSDQQLRQIIHDRDIELYVLYFQGSPAGYAELNFAQYPDVELVHFGLVPESMGRGLGRYFLTRLIELVWSRSPNRLHIQTCTLDHPAALGLYRKCGFVPFDKVVKEAEELV